METAVGDWRDQEAANQTIFREMNEWTEEDRDAKVGIDRLMDIYLCECSDPRCTEPISLTRAEYEDVRGVPVRFAIAVNHENPEIDCLVAENARFATVDQCYGSGARIARESDPRR
jgi:hypothetical protein